MNSISTSLACSLLMAALMHVSPVRAQSAARKDLVSAIQEAAIQEAAIQEAATGAVANMEWTVSADSLCAELGATPSSCQAVQVTASTWIVATGDSLLYADSFGIAELVVHDADGALHSVDATELKPQHRSTRTCPQSIAFLIGTRRGQIYELCGQRLRPVADANDFVSSMAPSTGKAEKVSAKARADARQQVELATRTNSSDRIRIR